MGQQCDSRSASEGVNHAVVRRSIDVFGAGVVEHAARIDERCVKSIEVVEASLPALSDRDFGDVVTTGAHSFRDPSNGQIRMIQAEIEQMDAIPDQ